MFFNAQAFPFVFVLLAPVAFHIVCPKSQRVALGLVAEPSPTVPSGA